MLHAGDWVSAQDAASRLSGEDRDQARRIVLDLFQALDSRDAGQLAQTIAGVRTLQIEHSADILPSAAAIRAELILDRIVTLHAKSSRVLTHLPRKVQEREDHTDRPYAFGQCSD